MFRGHSKTRFRGRGSGSAQKVPLKGLFTGGVWHCNCEPRLPAQHFQTKNGGKNHGRWFYTCQKPQPTRCDFFLWNDEARPREAAVLLNNSRSEPQPPPATPSKAIVNTGYLTPETGTRLRRQSHDVITSHTPSKSDPPLGKSLPELKSASEATTQDDSEEFYEWPLSDDEALSKAADEVPSRPRMPPPETPRKAAKKDLFSTPGKRRFDEIDDGEFGALPTSTSATNGDDVFTTPAAHPKGMELFPLSKVSDTPTPVRFRDAPPANGAESSLTAEVLAVFQKAQISLPGNVQDEVKSICNKQSLFTHGVIKGRDVSRSLVTKRDEKIAELQDGIGALRSERETSRAVIRHLRRELGRMGANST